MVLLPDPALGPKVDGEEKEKLAAYRKGLGPQEVGQGGWGAGGQGRGRGRVGGELRGRLGGRQGVACCCVAGCPQACPCLAARLLLPPACLPASPPAWPRAAVRALQAEAIVANTHALKKLQETPDSADALACVPSLKLSDIPKTITKVRARVAATKTCA